MEDVIVWTDPFDPFFVCLFVCFIILLKHMQFYLQEGINTTTTEELQNELCIIHLFEDLVIIHKCKSQLCDMDREQTQSKDYYIWYLETFS